MPKLLDDRIEEMHTAVVNQNRYKISHGLSKPLAPRNRVQHAALLFRGNRRVLPDSPQIRIRP